MSGLLVDEHFEETNLERLAGLRIARDRRHSERLTEALKHLVILLDLSLPDSHGLEGANLEMARRAHDTRVEPLS